MKTKGRNYSQLLIWAAVLVTVVRYAGAFVASDLGEVTGGVSAALSIGMGLSGLGMGLLDVLGGAYLFDGWRHAMPQAGKTWPFRFRVLTIFVFGLIVTGIGILVPFTVSRVAHERMDIVLKDWLWGWSILVNIAPYLLIGGVVTGTSGVVSVGGAQLTGQMSGQNGQVSGQMTGQNGQLSGQIPYDWRKLKKALTAEQLAELAGMRTEDICFRYGINDRQARRWSTAASAALKDEHPAGGEPRP